MISGPGAGEPDPGTEAPVRTTRERDGHGAILAVLAAGLALRFIIAYLLPGSGFGVDLISFQSWAANLAQQGPFGFYGRPFFHDYTPGYLYVLWAMGLLSSALTGLGALPFGPWTETDLLKAPAILADLALGWLVFSMARDLGASRRAARLGAILVVLNPMTWFDSVIWGQVDSFGVVFLLLGLRELWRDRTERAAVLTVIAAIIKPQLGILVPIVAAVTIRRALRPTGGFGDDQEPPGLASDWGWERRVRGPVRVVATAGVGLLTAIALSLPFGLSLPGLIAQIFSTAGGYPFLSVNAYNPWALLSLNGNGIAQNSQWVRDAPVGAEPYFAFGPIPAVVVGTLLLLLVFAAVTIRVAHRPDRRTMLVGLAVLAIAFFVVPTRVHERYLFPLVAIGALLAASSWRWRLAYVVASAAALANMYVVLTTLYSDNPNARDWFGIGPAIQSSTGVTIVAVSLLVVFLFALSQLRDGALAALGRALDGQDRGRRPDDDLLEPDAPAEFEAFEPDPPGGAPDPAGDANDDRVETAPAPLTVPRVPGVRWTEPGAPGPALVAHPAAAATSLSVAGDRDARPSAPAIPHSPVVGARPTVIEAGYGGWIRSRLFERPVRPDRSRELHGETGGRVDRLDLWVIAVLVISILTIRVWRLAEPYQMHFDEVYHPRTATEFLQDWRYGIDHDIYEWTHPHLAKYAMAGGLVVWGDDRVNATSSLGVPVTAAAIEPRWDGSATAGNRSGDRLYVATGDQVRAYDLATRALVGVIDLPGAVAVSVDTGRHQLFIGTTSGDLLVRDTLSLDVARRSGTAATGSISLGADTIGHVDGVIRTLFSGTDGTAVVAVLDGDRVATFAANDGRLLGIASVTGVTQLSPAGSSNAVLATTAQVTSPGDEAILLAQIVGGSPGDIEARLRSGADVVFVGGTPTGDNKTRLDAAIAAGQLPGITSRLVRRIAVAGRDGVAFLDSETGAVMTRLDLGGPVGGVGRVIGIDDEKLYATVDSIDGPIVALIRVADGESTKDGPSREGQFRLPGVGGPVTYDKASQMLHILGVSPDGAGQTVYVVEPHGNAVYADAPVPFQPVGLAMDANERYPSADREQLLVLAADGTVASINVGSHAFAWRLPGVICGAILAALLYLLARLLFRRRSVALLTAFLVAADGMLFVQSRIGMNDSYVGMFIVAAYVAFAALWTGRWRGRTGWAAFWLLMPVIGLMLGLALAAKWVAAYSIGALGILVLTRSALGRLVLIVGMILATWLLGYMAITVPAGSGLENILFLVIMVALTGVAVVATVVHPIAWSWEEQRLATMAPGVAGVAVVLGALALGQAGTELVLGPVKVTAFEAAFALILLSGLVRGAFLLAGRRGLGPMARIPGPDDPAAILEPSAPAPEGWLRPGAALGLPVVWLLVCLVGLPLGIYVASYLPWAAMEGHQLWPGFPVGHTGQTLVELTEQMYRYHNTLTSAHPASSPWWAWPFDLKPVWFYQESFAGGTSASIYDAGNLVSWWVAVPALVFVAWQAFRRRSLALALVAVGFACQWIAWARIDRAAFQYHYYTSLPFVLLALAYFLAEVWHGASKRVWLLARLAGAGVVIGPMALWLFHRPLCAFVRVNDVYPNSPSCPTLVPDLVLSYRALGLAIVVGLGVLAILRQFAALGRAGAEREVTAGLPGRAAPDWLRPMLPLLITAALTAIAQFVVGRLAPETSLITLQNIPVEPLALMLLLPLLALASVVATARDARRYVLGLLMAIGGWFVLWYPNLSALPLPYAMVNTYQGLLPTYVYTFQFPVNTVNRDVVGPGLLSAGPLELLAAVTITSLVIAYSAWSWRLALAEGFHPRWRRGRGAPEAQTPIVEAQDGLAHEALGAQAPDAPATEAPATDGRPPEG